ncbi:MAG: hypothetical protein HQL72_06310 [Magnetococcales bacterium]|nr:hypothetical protein [Magnetococcales bacterium]
MSEHNLLPDPLMLTNPLHQQQIRLGADRWLAAGLSYPQLIDQEQQQSKNRDHYPFAAQLALKLARSRQFLAHMEQPLHLSVVFAIYKEHTRILSRDEHPHGEDFLREKIRQMQWLCRDLPLITWDMIVVDDGCPEGSGVLAEQTLANHPRRKGVEVLFLQQAIQQRHPAIQPLTSTEQSRKGGAVTLGMWQAAQRPHPNSIILFTDADLSTDLGQCGLLVEGIVEGKGDAAIGSRREPCSIVIKGGQRNHRGKLFIYLWKRLLPNLSEIIDTQCGFKAFKASTARLILDDLQEKQFAFDIELLLKTELNRPGSIEKIPIAWFDSEAASTTTDLQPYLPMLRSIVGFYRRYLPPQPEAEGFAQLIDQLDETTWHQLLSHMPAEISQREPALFNHSQGLTANDLAKAAGLSL